ncbi:hypothetical protein [Sporolactobacillus laevolacticus]|uniref:Uncharacterized protein n=1 Tax=Sporolactobacillus laevolacticus DSM 442 TaxID=1395513 RepID=V6IXD9_9BACL|nr:hypothetical protein [Sporolactobacillus laevolacticus]EST12002.1 hypothetical protein P343_09925 [Sporolactobacillus laevolacticus DSM 442]
MTLMRIESLPDAYDEEEQSGFSSPVEYWDHQYALKINGIPHSPMIDRQNEDPMGFSFTDDQSIQVRKTPLLSPGVYDFTLKRAYMKKVQGSKGTEFQCFFFLSILDYSSTGITPEFLYSCNVSRDPKSEFAQFLNGYRSCFGTSQWRIKDLEESSGKLAVYSLTGDCPCERLRVLSRSVRLERRLHLAYLQSNS